MFKVIKGVVPLTCQPYFEISKLLTIFECVCLNCLLNKMFTLFPTGVLAT